MNVEEIPIAELDLDPANVRQHDEKNLAAIKSSLKRFGQQKPIVVDPKGIVIAGNGTLTAARALGWDRIRIVRTQLEGSEATAYAIADNRTAELATWDDDALMQQLSALDLEDSALVEAAGFSAAELEGMVDGLLGEKELNEDEVPEVPEDPITQPGDLWILGDHRLLCGDSMNDQDVDRLMAGLSADAVVTDPPYGTGISASKGLGNSKVPMRLVGDEDASLARDAFEFWSKKSDAQIWWGANYYSDVLPGVSSWAVWDKDHHGMTFADAELAYVSMGGPVRVFRHAWSGNHRASERDTVRQHPTQKPVALYVWIFETWGESFHLIADPFLGSGTTLIAAEQLGRRCFGMEISPQYCDVIVERWENLTGRKAELERRADDDQEKIQSQA